MCALLDSFAPDKVNFSNFDPNDNAHNEQLAVDAMKQLNVSICIQPEYCQSDIDIKCVLIQLAAARIVLENLPVVLAVKIEESRIISNFSDCFLVEEPEPEPEEAHAPAPVLIPPTPAPKPPTQLKETKRHHYFGDNNNYFASCNKFY